MILYQLHNTKSLPCPRVCRKILSRSYAITFFHTLVHPAFTVYSTPSHHLKQIPFTLVSEAFGKAPRGLVFTVKKFKCFLETLRSSRRVGWRRAF
jgi:hypothetical protein